MKRGNLLKRNFVLAILALIVVAYFSGNITLAHTPSPPICNDPICNIDIHDTFFELDNITIRPPNPVTQENVTVVWVNHGALTHSVTSGLRGSADPVFDVTLAPGGTFELTVNQTIYDQLIAKYGSAVPYYCKFHLGMDATLNILGDPIPEFSLPTYLLSLALTSVALLIMHTRLRKPIGNTLQRK